MKKMKRKVFKIALFVMILFAIFSLKNKILAKTAEESQENVVSGVIQEDTTWEKGSYYINGNLTVNENVTLTVQEGVTIKIQNGRGIQVLGNLQLKGTAENNINIQPQNANEYLANIYVKENGKIEAKYTNIEHVKGSGQVGNEYFMDIYGSLYLDNVKFYDIKEGAKLLTLGSKDIVIKNSILDGGILVVNKYGNLEIKNNRIYKILIDTISNENYIIENNIILSEDADALKVNYVKVPGEFKVYNNCKEGQTRQQLQFAFGVFEKSMILAEDNDCYFINGLRIEANSTLTISKGNNLYIGEDKAIQI